jgi:hypothetical protein
MVVALGEEGEEGEVDEVAEVDVGGRTFNVIGAEVGDKGRVVM